MATFECGLCGRVSSSNPCQCWRDESDQAMAAAILALRRSHSHAESMRRKMVRQLDEVSEMRDFWDKESARLLSQIEKHMDMIGKKK